METASSDANALDALVRSIRACRVCRDNPRYGQPLAHEPRPILQISKTARICIVGQAPGTRVNKSGRPFDDPSGVRLRQWLGIDETTFYDSSKVAIIGMGFCFPGLRPDGSDLPPRRECAEIWRAALFAQMRNVKLLVIIGGYAQRWHLGQKSAQQGVNQTVQQWRDVYDAGSSIRRIPLPHPSWHNNKWLERNTWFDTDLLPVLRADVRRLLR
ncbi:MAG: uracil-DNA glycosylase family protein [Hyphomicrobium sp.]|nr:uracil-DNA glycosylase family protein [Hyphomicrobium sp.]MBY0562345.1 uracil-DNA glycosylase family protein [Hyphomicrobium sp.]